MSATLWLDPATGFCSDSMAEGREPIQLEQPLPWYLRLEGDDLLNWFARHALRCDAQEAAINEEYDRLVAALEAQRAARLREVECRRRAADWLLGHRVRAEVDRRLAEMRGQRRSIDTAWSRLGYRAVSRVEIFDEEQALDWSERNAPEAIKVERSLLRTRLPKAALKAREIPGAEIVEEDRFYVQPAVKGEVS